MPARRFGIGVGLGTALLCATLTGCGNTYRPVLTAINPVGPAGQPVKYAVAISTDGAGNAGLVNIVDVFGDTVLVTVNIAPDPQYLILNSAGNTAYTYDALGTLNSFDVSSQLQTRDVLKTTLLSSANPASIFPQGANVYLTEAGRTSIADLQGTPPALKQELSVGSNPIYVVGINNSARAYAISQGAKPGTSAGQVAAIETSTNTISNLIPVGRTPVYGVMTAGSKRAFIMNSGDGTVSVINSQTNQLDLAVSTIPVGVKPVWADFAPTLAEMAVANAGDGHSPGTLSIVSIPLCTVTTLPGNPNCDPANPIDAVGFGQVLANVKVGVNPVVVAVLQDGTRAYVANAGNPAASPAIPGSISVVDLTTNTVTATIPAVTPDANGNCAASPSGPLTICGRPNFLALTTGVPTGKIYVTSAESTVMTVMATDTDSVQTYIPLQGRGVMVRVTQP